MFDTLHSLHHTHTPILVKKHANMAKIKTVGYNKRDTSARINSGSSAVGLRIIERHRGEPEAGNLQIRQKLLLAEAIKFGNIVGLEKEKHQAEFLEKIEKIKTFMSIETARIRAEKLGEAIRSEENRMHSQGRLEPSIIIELL